MKKKILFTSETFLPLVGGGELYTLHFVEHLVRKGYRVTLLTNTVEQSELSLDHVEVIRCAWPGWRYPLRMFKLFRVLVSHAKDSDMIFANYTYRLGFIAAGVALITRKPLTAFAHGLGTIIDSGFPWTYYVYRFFVLKVASSVVSTSQEIADIVRPFNQNVTVATAVDFDELDSRATPEAIQRVRDTHKGKKIILTVRRLVPKNGIQYLVEALQYMPEKESWVYVMIGGGRLEQELKKTVSALGLEANVKFLGETDNALVPAYIGAADVVVFPSSAEAMSLACIEVMHFARPVVTTSVGGLVELVGENEERGSMIDLFGRRESVYTAPPVNSIEVATYKDFAMKIQEALASEAALSRARGAQEYVNSRFGWDKVSGDILTFIKAK